MDDMERKKSDNLSKQRDASRVGLEMNPKSYKRNYSSGSLESRGLENDT